MESSSDLHRTPAEHGLKNAGLLWLGTRKPESLARTPLPRQRTADFYYRFFFLIVDDDDNTSCVYDQNTADDGLKTISEREREREIKWVCVCVYIYVLCVCVCVCATERENGTQRPIASNLIDRYYIPARISCRRRN